MKVSEYGGADTHKTSGIQPAPHQLNSHEELRLGYQTEPATDEPIADPTVAE